MSFQLFVPFSLFLSFFSFLYALSSCPTPQADLSLSCSSLFLQPSAPHRQASYSASAPWAANAQNFGLQVSHVVSRPSRKEENRAARRAQLSSLFQVYDVHHQHYHQHHQQYPQQQQLYRQQQQQRELIANDPNNPAPPARSYTRKAEKTTRGKKVQVSILPPLFSNSPLPPPSNSGVQHPVANYPDFTGLVPAHDLPRKVAELPRMSTVSGMTGGEKGASARSKKRKADDEVVQNDDDAAKEKKVRSSSSPSRLFRSSASCFFLYTKLLFSR